MVKNILLIISGSIASYKALELIRLLRQEGAAVRAILTAGGAEFITPLAVSSLTGTPTYTDLFSLKDEVEMGHIRLSREAEAIIVAPASADLLAKMAQGRADDLASAVLLAADKPVWIAPAMNHRMWAHPATRRNIAQLTADGVRLVGPVEGEMACGEYGPGRMADPAEIVRHVMQGKARRSGKAGSLKGKTALVTAGPTQEPIDDVRFLGNRSSGRQGYAIAGALAMAGAKVTLVSGPTFLRAPEGVTCIPVMTAQEMYDAALGVLPVDMAVCTAAVADWTPEAALPGKLKKRRNAAPPELRLRETPDILAAISKHKQRPALVAGFAAEAGELEKQASEKRMRKGCDWILANDISGGRVFGEERTELLFITEDAAEPWGCLSKQEAAARLVEEAEKYFLGKG